MKFEDIPIRMLQLGVDRDWLASQCDYSPRTMAAILAPNASPANKTEKALRRMWEALDREEARQKTPTSIEEKCAIVVRPTADEYNVWNDAALKENLRTEDWAIQALNKAAKAKNYFTMPESLPIVAEDPAIYGTNKNKNEI